MKKSNSTDYFLLVLLAIGFIWAKSSLSKLIAGNFLANLESTLTKFASKNPFPWYKDFLESVAIPNVSIFGNLVFWSEAFVGLTLLLLPTYLLVTTKPNRYHYKFLLLALVGGALMNGFFWLASAWTSPSSDSINLLMLVLEVFGIFYTTKKLRDLG